MSAIRRACGFDETDPSRYQTGEMAADELVQFERHLPECPSCSAGVSLQRRLDALVPQLPMYPLRSPPPLRHRRVGRRGVAGAALLAAAGLAGFLLVPLQRRDTAGLVAEATASDAAVIEGLIRTVPEQPHPRTEGSSIPWLGFVTCSEDIVPDVEGVYICALDRESSLALEGVRAGDVLVGLDSRLILSHEEMFTFLADRQPGELVTAYVRTEAGNIRRVQAGLSRREFGQRHPFGLEWSPALLASLERPVRPDEDINQIFVPLTDAAAAPLGAPSGILVAVEPRRGAEAGSILGLLLYAFGPGGLRAGDIIIDIRGRPAENRAELLKAFINDRPDSFTVSIYRDGAPHVLRFQRSQAAPVPGSSPETRRH